MRARPARDPRGHGRRPPTCRAGSARLTRRVTAPPAAMRAPDWEQLAGGRARLPAVRAAARRARRPCSASATGARGSWSSARRRGPRRTARASPSSGRAGMLLNAMLRAAGFERERGVHRQRAEVPSAEQSRPQRRGSRRAACRTCAGRSSWSSPQVILCVGRIAAQRLLDTDTPIGTLRGRVHRFGGRARRS